MGRDDDSGLPAAWGRGTYIHAYIAYIHQKAKGSPRRLALLPRAPAAQHEAPVPAVAVPPVRRRQLGRWGFVGWTIGWCCGAVGGRADRCTDARVHRHGGVGGEGVPPSHTAGRSIP